MKKTFALMLLSFVLSGVSHAQALGSIVGTVTDQQGAGMPSATVKATEVDTNILRVPLQPTLTGTSSSRR